MKILVVRFSSIGDIVLTTPVLEALKDQLNCELHYLTKEPYKELVEHNPFVDKVFTIKDSISEVIPALKAEKYDHIVDLHHNLRTKSLKLRLLRPMTSFPKLNYKKWKLVRFKADDLPDVHVVDRYFEAVKKLTVSNRKYAVNFAISSSNEIDPGQYKLAAKNYIAIAIGAKFATKRFPKEKVVEVIERLNSDVILIGGIEDRSNAGWIIQRSSKNVRSAVGEVNIQQSGSIIKQAKALMTNDTGMMHIAAAFDTRIVSIWGNTVPKFGMYPYKPDNPESYSIHEVSDLSCRPCSKIGFEQCPKKHFKCMMDQDVNVIAGDLEA